MPIVRRFASIAAAIAFATLIASGCSWDYPVWPKNKKSDTPLFRFVIRERDGAGYIDLNGRVIIPPALSHFGNYGTDDFFDGLANVRMKKEGWYIDATGKPAFRAFASRHFSEGLASTIQRGKAGYIDREGKLIIPASFDSADDFSEGLAAVGINHRYGYINKDGSFAIRPKYTLANAFSEGVARVIEEGQCLYIGYGPCSSFNPMNLPYIPRTQTFLDLPRCRYSFIDRQRTRLFENKYPDAKDFAEALAPVGDGKLWGYVDKKGTLVVPKRYEDAEPFAEGLARVYSGGKWGYIDRTGNMVVPATYRSALDFSEGLAVVGDGDLKSWFIDTKGHQAIPQFYTDASSFVMGRAHVRNGVDYYTAKWSYIDHNGRAVFTYSVEPSSERNAAH